MRGATQYKSCVTCCLASVFLSLHSTMASTVHAGSWEERFDQTYAMVNGHPENMTVSAGHRGHGGWTDPNGRRPRNNGWTFRAQWDR